MEDVWAEKLTCATHCHRCSQNLGPKEQRILSVYDHEAICMDCKNDEENRPDYEDISKCLFMIMRPYAWIAKMMRKIDQIMKTYPSR
jgi:hypothetical protein